MTGSSSQAGLASFTNRPRPSRGAWERMLADEHERGLHGDGCSCSSAELSTNEQEQ